MSLAGLNPVLRQAVSWCLAQAAAHGIRPTITSVSRSFVQQAQLYRRYLDGRSPWPANPPGQTAHHPWWTVRTSDGRRHRGALAWDSTVPAQHQALWNAIRTAAGFHLPANDEIHAEIRDWQALV